ncbi:DUF2516 family protein [Aeromicrobium sp. UC242_57]|uniref:DUF2516 family protein n=1 Tax=Aeromicrobium sp. UC242_57 TaxID=3374624 RepID=UPI00378BEAF9
MFDVAGGLTLVLSVALFAVKGFALADCVGRPASQFASYETLPKNTWLLLLILALVGNLFSWNPLGLLNLLGTVAALVYLAQVRGSSH